MVFDVIPLHVHPTTSLIILDDCIIKYISLIYVRCVPMAFKIGTFQEMIWKCSELDN